MRSRVNPWFRDSNERPFRVAAEAAERAIFATLVEDLRPAVWYFHNQTYLPKVPIPGDCGLGFCEHCGSPLQPTSGGKSQCRRCGYLDTCCDRTP